MFLESLQSRKDRRILLWLIFFRAKCVIAEGVEADGLRLVRRKLFGKNGTKEPCISKICILPRQR